MVLNVCIPIGDDGNEKNSVAEPVEATPRSQVSETVNTKQPQRQYIR